MTPEELDALAKDLHHEWDSPSLWPRITRAAAPPRKRWPRAVALIALAAALTLAIFWAPWREHSAAPATANAPLLTDDAKADVEAAEATYRRAIERLARVAAPRLNAPETPLNRAYAEKLRLLDGAIANLRAELNRNGFNAHLHSQMAAIYRDKQKTLEEVLRYD